MTKNYIVTEIQHNALDQVATSTLAFPTKDQANANYHQILSAAAVSALPLHGAVMYTEDGVFIKGECFKHEVNTDG